jgi:phosphatidate cytidylyltransferase
MSNLQVRILSALVLAAVALALTWAGGFAFRVLCAAAAAAVFYEWTSMLRPALDARRAALGWLLLAAVLAALLAGAPAAWLFGAAALSFVVFVAVLRLGGQGIEPAVALAYAAVAAIAVALLRNADAAGLMAILFLFAVNWATDIFAYFVGKAFGGPKLAPAISPGKTWSGALGGAAGGIVAGLLAASLSGHAGFGVFVVALVLSIVSQAGDLFESAVKRRHGAKDSSNLIPGHGGVMDRIDGLVAAGFALYLVGAMSGGADQPAHGLFPL